MLIQTIKDNNIYASLEALGYPVEEMFSDLTEDKDKLYSEYLWVKSECHVPGVDKEYVINAIPVDFNALAWEEWYASEGKLIHHILCKDKWPECTDEAFIPANDKNHPETIIGKKWFYFEDEDIRPYFARG